MMRKNAQLDWDNLRVFLAVARAGRAAAAARRLRVEHTTVSRRLAALEAQLGAPVFHRTVGGYVLTAEGQSILSMAEAMERAALSMGVGVREITGRLAGTVRVGMPPEFASDWFAGHVPAFRARYPEIQLEILVGTRTLDLSRGEAELAIRSPRPQQVGLVTARIAHTSVRLYASRALIGRKRMRIADADAMAGHALLTYPASLNILQSAAWFQPVKAAATVALESNGTHTLLNAARAGAGIAMLPAFMARQYPDLTEVSDAVGEQDVWLVMHPDHRRDPKVRATADFLKLAAKELS
ncbi:MAG TPA: LysR family transcriptional regulator [Gemmatimonadaceae bacterium]|nr:LysR family transcriptional regulator [Gemmatimonadaceae bacterium]